MNRVFLSGNLTRDPEVRYSQTGMAFARMGIAVQRRVSKNKDANRDGKDVDFFNLVAFDKTAEFCGKYLTKGSRILVEGRLQTSSYENRDGVKVNAVDVIADNIEFASSKRADNGDGGYPPRDSRSDDSYQRDSRSDDGYRQRNNRSDDGGYRPPEKPQPKKPDDDFGEPLDLEDPPF